MSTSMFLIPTMDDWYRLAGRKQEKLVLPQAMLKDFGLAACADFIDSNYGSQGKDVRILEMGHGFSPDTMAKYQDKHEVWGVDDDQKLAYFNHVDWEENYKARVVAPCPNVHLVRGLIGASSQPSELLADYFDVILSISILEEVPVTTLREILTGAAGLLKPGGFLIGTHDLRGQMLPKRVQAYLDIHAELGLEIVGAPVAADIRIDWEYALVEHPAAVMLWYQQEHSPDVRRYWGHFTTMWTVARKIEGGPTELPPVLPASRG